MKIKTFTKSIFTLVLVCMQITIPARAGHLTLPVEHDLQDTTLTAAEEAAVRDLAKLFTKRLYEVKDITPLIDEFFVPNFPENILTDGVEDGETPFFSKFTHDELERGTAAALNMMFYLSLSHENKDGSRDGSQHKLFPPMLDEKLIAFGENGFASSADEGLNPAEFLASLIGMERTVAEARDHLRGLLPERTPVLTRATAGWNEDAAYTMKEYQSDDVPAGSKAMQVFLPFLLDIVVVKVDGKWKIWVMFPDGD